MSFGALFVPVIYLMATRWRGAARRQMLVGAGFQIFCSLMVCASVYFSWRSGHADYYHGWALLLPVNAIGLIYFVVVLFVYARKP